MAYKLPNLTLAQYRLLPADEQYLLISSIHSLYEKLLGLSPTPAQPTRRSRPAPAPVEPQPEIPAQLNVPTARERAFRRGSSSAYIMEIFLEAGDGAALTPDEIFKRVSDKTQAITKGAIWRVLPALVSQGVLVKDGDGRAGGRYRLKR